MCGRSSGEAAPSRRPAVLDLTVRNHPGVMSHVCGLFARRAFNLDGIHCIPVNGGATSRMRLLVADDERLDQLVKQLEKLVDVLAVERRPAAAGLTPEELLRDA